MKTINEKIEEVKKEIETLKSLPLGCCNICENSWTGRLIGMNSTKLEAYQEAKEIMLSEIENIENSYPKDIFLELELEEWQRDKLDEFLESNFGFGLDRLSAELMRKARFNLIEELKQKLKGELAE